MKIAVDTNVLVRAAVRDDGDPLFREGEAGEKREAAFPASKPDTDLQPIEQPPLARSHI